VRQTLSADELEIVFEVYDDSPAQQSQLYTAHRATVNDPFGARTRIGATDARANNYAAMLTGDALTLFFASDQGGAPGLFRATHVLRAATSSERRSP
jgi:hypothetical protein